jgi:hypothetical protein
MSLTNCFIHRALVLRILPREIPQIWYFSKYLGIRVVSSCFLLTRFQERTPPFPHVLGCISKPLNHLSSCIAYPASHPHLVTPTNRMGEGFSSVVPSAQHVDLCIRVLLPVLIHFLPFHVHLPTMPLRWYSPSDMRLQIFRSVVEVESLKMIASNYVAQRV